MTYKLQTHIESLTADIAQLVDILENNATRENVKLLLVTWIDKFNNERENSKQELERQVPKKVDDAQEESKGDDGDGGKTA